MIANQNELVPMTTDENGVSIPNQVTAKQSVPTRAIDNFYSIIIGGNTKNRPDGIIGKFKQINERHKKAWLKTVWYNSIFFPVAEIFSSLICSSKFCISFSVMYCFFLPGITSNA